MDKEKQTKLQKTPEKQTKPQKTPASAPEVRPNRAGPRREKLQITLRLDQELMDHVYALSKDQDLRVTDIVERGLQLALDEARFDVPPWTKQVRFILANATRNQLKLIRGLAIAMMEQEVEPAMPLEVKKLFEFISWFLDLRNTMPHAKKALELYSRYGKTAEEIAKLGA